MLDLTEKTSRFKSIISMMLCQHQLCLNLAFSFFSYHGVDSTFWDSNQNTYLGFCFFYYMFVFTFIHVDYVASQPTPGIHWWWSQVKEPRRDGSFGDSPKSWLPDGCCLGREHSPCQSQSTSGRLEGSHILYSFIVTPYT